MSSQRTFVGTRKNLTVTFSWGNQKSFILGINIGGGKTDLIVQTVVFLVSEDSSIATYVLFSCVSLVSDIREGRTRGLKAREVITSYSEGFQLQLHERSNLMSGGNTGLNSWNHRVD